MPNGDQLEGPPERDWFLRILWVLILLTLIALAATTDWT
jgi:hypothetical protein